MEITFHVILVACSPAVCVRCTTTGSSCWCRPLTPRHISCDAPNAHCSHHIGISNYVVKQHFATAFFLQHIFGEILFQRARSYGTGVFQCRSNAGTQDIPVVHSCILHISRISIAPPMHSFRHYSANHLPPLFTSFDCGNLGFWGNMGTS
ncbi:uncharacterized protein HMPREF1120_04894 [Exophiala dermatitidis NIH/UT8656]|uniref:Secreted protein n=1 Tax=Exophiala dermatitidis (strain ATCC 34100 / CBS 525.76 / NIH/UT8656) TaxID=858893 RepID=H6BYW8_EXODN|nr:uncharacterized protein HMPREF1120_04894 [Exophiala dermatitidis NIH/UT8656]EHY56829.1 hypothetical protein HMPREF1120_04894 [Exophiala dermatitidis NIH/UT8656]